MKKACKRIKQKETTQETWVSGQFVSEADMIDMGIKESRRNSIKAECATMKGWIRPGVAWVFSFSKCSYSMHISIYTYIYTYSCIKYTH